MDKKPPNYKWNKESCLIEAKKYDHKIDFKTNVPGAYSSSRINKWLGEICSHMTPKGNRNNRLIYSYEFTDNCVYVGLTGNPNKRKWDHLNKKNSAVYNHIQKTKLIPLYEQLTGYLPLEKSIEMEKYHINNMIEKGYFLLNDLSKIGLIGGSTIKWTKEKCRKVFLEFNTITELRKKYPTVYNNSSKNGWLKDFSHHMKYTPNGFWNNENNCSMESINYKNRTEFKINSPGAYFASIKNKWINDICSHMIKKREPKNYWTKETCKLSFMKLGSKKEFRKQHSRAYSLSTKNKWLDEFIDLNL